MEISSKLHTIKSGRSIIYIEGSQVIISKKYSISQKSHFVLANSSDPDEMPHHAACTACLDLSNRKEK